MGKSNAAPKMWFGEAELMADRLAGASYFIADDLIALRNAGVDHLLLHGVGVMERERLDGFGAGVFEAVLFKRMDYLPRISFPSYRTDSIVNGGEE